MQIHISQGPLKLLVYGQIVYGHLQSSTDDNAADYGQALLPTTYGYIAFPPRTASILGLKAKTTRSEMNITFRFIQRANG